jgi:outer membrane protein assembly factor BamB
MPLVDLRPPFSDWSIGTDTDVSKCTAPRDITPQTYVAPLAVTPALKWKCHLAKGELPLTSPIEIGSQIVVTSMIGGIQAVSLEGALLWSLPPPAADPSWFMNFGAMGIGDSVFFGDGAWRPIAYGKVHAVSLTGSEKWQRSLDGPFSDKVQPVNGPSLAGDGAILVGGGDKTLYALDSATGEIKRRMPLPAVAQDIVVDSTGTTYVSLFGSSTLVALSAAGKLLWTRALIPSLPAPSSPTNEILGLAIAPTGDVIAAAYFNNTGKPSEGKSKVMSIDPGCGRVRWTTAIDRVLRGPLVGLDGAILFAVMYYGEGNDALLSLSPQGETSWRKELGTALGTGSSAKFVGIGPLGADGTLHALVYARGNGPDPRVVGFSQNGDITWNLAMPTMQFDLGIYQPVLLKDGTLVFGAEVMQRLSSDVFLVAVQTRSPGLATSAWPRVHHDNRSTSNVTTPL